MEQYDPKLLAFAVSIIVMTIVLWRGIAVILSIIRTSGSDGIPMLAHVLSEKDVSAAPPPGTQPTNPAPNSPVPVTSPSNASSNPTSNTGSFSRTAGAVGAMALAAAVVGISYWLLYALFYEKNIDVLKTAGWFFLSGSALFAPYAFNKLSSVFK